MNKKSLLLLAVLSGSSMAAMAEDLDLSKQLNGLKVKAELVGGGDASGTQALHLTNQDSVAIVCVLQPGSAEADDAKSPPAVMAPGQSATLRVDGKYTGAPLQAALQCKKK